MIAIICLHVISMVLGFASLIAHDAILVVLSRSGSQHFVRSTLQGTSNIGTIGKIFLIAGVLSGLYLAAPFGYGATWLVGSYVLVAVAIALGIAVIEPYKRRLRKAASADDGGIATFRPSSLPTAVICINALCWAGAIWLMVAKP